VKFRLTAFIGVVSAALAVSTGWSIEATWDYSVQVSAAVDASAGRVTLSWPQDSTSTPSGYSVYRKAVNAGSWNGIASLPGSATSYVDSGLASGTIYEYQVQKAGSGYTAYGYVCAGLNAPLVENRGKVVLVVESTYAANLGSELTRLQQDLIGDGWTVVRRDVSRTASPTQVRDTIRAVYSADTANTKAVFLSAMSRFLTPAISLRTAIMIIKAPGQPTRSMATWTEAGLITRSTTPLPDRIGIATFRRWQVRSIRSSFGGRVAGRPCGPGEYARAQSLGRPSHFPERT
jgi:hypothetical protein